MYLQVSVIELVISQKIVQYYSSGIEIYNSLIAESKEREFGHKTKVGNQKK